MMGKKKLSTKLLFWFFLILGAFFAGFPVLWMLLSSFKSNVNMFMWPPKFIDESFGFHAYKKVLSDPVKIRFFLNSYFVAIVVVIITLIVGIMAAYAFSRYQFKGKEVLNTIIVSVQAVPGIVLMIPYISLIVTLKIFNTYWALILTYLVFTLPYCILLLTGYFNTIATELDEAVMIDGGSRMLVLWRILVPVSLPGIISVGMYTFMKAWNEYLFALVLTKTIEMRTVTVGINLLMGQHSYDWNQMMAMSFLGSLPILVLFIFFQRYFIAGVSAGAVKG